MRSVNARRFREARHLCVLSQQATADLLRVSLRTVKNWESGNFRVPYAAYKLMRILRGYQLPGESWRGWNLKGDILWSPEGRPFRASDHGWWSLIVAKADAFDRIATAASPAPQTPSERPAALGLVYSETSDTPKAEFRVNASAPGASPCPPNGCYAAARDPAGSRPPELGASKQVAARAAGGAP